MVSWVYDVNAWLVAADSRAAWAALVAGAAACWLGGLALTGYCYYLYAPSPGCHLNLFFLTWSLVVGAALAAVLFLPTRLEEAGLLTSGAVFLYAAYLLFSALGRVPQGACARSVPSEHWVTVGPRAGARPAARPAVDGLLATPRRAGRPRAHVVLVTCMEGGRRLRLHPSTLPTHLPSQTPRPHNLPRSWASSSESGLCATRP
jgi:hypothetical protein